MAVLSSAKSEPVSILAGEFNQIVDIIGFPRPQESFGTPADVIHLAGLPTVKDALPMPIDVWSRMSKVLRSGRGPINGMPALPDPKRLFDMLPKPGEAISESDIGQRMADQLTGGKAVPEDQGRPLAQKYYQRRQ